DSPALDHGDYAVRLRLADPVYQSTRPVHFQVCRSGGAQAKVNPQIALRDVAAAAPHLVHLPMRLSFYICGADNPRPDAGSIRFGAGGLYLDPVVPQLGTAA